MAMTPRVLILACGFVDCGAGRDVLYVSRTNGPKVKRRHCEVISHLSDRQVHGG